MNLRDRLASLAERVSSAAALLAVLYVESVGSILERVDPDIGYRVVGSGVSPGLARYSRRAAAVLAVASAAGAAAGSLLATAAGMSLAAAVAAGLLGSVSLVSLVLAALASLPRILYNSRAARLEPRFPLFAASLATRLAAGMGVAEALLDMAERDVGDLPEFGIELGYIAAGLRAGRDPSSVLEEAARITPSPSLRGLLAALAAAARTGSGLREVVETMLTEYLFTVESQIDKTVAGLGALLELFVAASVMLPIALGVVGLLLVFQPIPGLSFTTLLFLTTFIATPMIAAAVVIIADSTVSRVRI